MKPTRIFCWLIQLATAAILAMAGYVKLVAHPESVAMFQMLNFEPGGRLVIGVLEMTAALFLLIPQSVIWGAVLAWGIMTGALIAHVTRIGFSDESAISGTMAAFIWLGSMLVIFLRRHQSETFRRMFSRAHDEEDSDSSDHP